MMVFCLLYELQADIPHILQVEIYYKIKTWFFGLSHRHQALPIICCIYSFSLMPKKMSVVWSGHTTTERHPCHSLCGQTHRWFCGRLCVYILCGCSSKLPGFYKLVEFKPPCGVLRQSESALTLKSFNGIFSGAQQMPMGKHSNHAS